MHLKLSEVEILLLGRPAASTFVCFISKRQNNPNRLERSEHIVRKSVLAHVWHQRRADGARTGCVHTNIIKEPEVACNGSHKAQQSNLHMLACFCKFDTVICSHFEAVYMSEKYAGQMFAQLAVITIEPLSGDLLMQWRAI